MASEPPKSDSETGLVHYKRCHAEVESCVHFVKGMENTNPQSSTSIGKAGGFLGTLASLYKLIVFDCSSVEGQTRFVFIAF